MPRHLTPVTGQIGLDGTVVEDTTNWPNEVRRAWIDGWVQSHQAQPPTAYRERMMGKVREVERAVTKHRAESEWPLWVVAGRAAGRSGQWDLIGFFPQARQQRGESKYEAAMRLADQLDQMGS